jgi:hypothetical protein
MGTTCRNGEMFKAQRMRPWPTLMLWKSKVQRSYNFHRQLWVLLQLPPVFYNGVQCELCYYLLNFWTLAAVGMDHMATRHLDSNGFGNSNQQGTFTQGTFTTSFPKTKAECYVKRRLEVVLRDVNSDVECRRDGDLKLTLPSLGTLEWIV